MKKIKFIDKDREEAKRFALSLVLSGVTYVIHPTLGRIVLALTVTSSASHFIDRIVLAPEKANS